MVPILSISIHQRRGRRKRFGSLAGNAASPAGALSPRRGFPAATTRAPRGRFSRPLLPFPSVPKVARRASPFTTAEPTRGSATTNRRAARMRYFARLPGPEPPAVPRSCCPSTIYLRALCSRVPSGSERVSVVVGIGCRAHRAAGAVLRHKLK